MASPSWRSGQRRPRLSQACAALRRLRPGGIQPARRITAERRHQRVVRRVRDEAKVALAAIRRFFRSGSGNVEVVQGLASSDIAVLVLIERQRAAIAHLTEQDWSVRVTLVFRHDAVEWRLVHRHADPLVHGITLDQAAAIARGAMSTPATMRPTPADRPSTGSVVAASRRASARRSRLPMRLDLFPGCTAGPRCG
jgi:hypothetical protein